jgi:hypothetical protein
MSLISAGSISLDSTFKDLITSKLLVIIQPCFWMKVQRVYLPVRDNLPRAKDK